MIDAEKIKPDQFSPKISGVDALDHRVEQPHQGANFPVVVSKLLCPMISLTAYTFASF